MNDFLKRIPDNFYQFMVTNNRYNRLTTKMNADFKFKSMEPKYYVSVRPRTNGQHGVHKEGCPFISCNDKLVYLGRFNSGKDAEKEGLMHFDNAKCCAFCSKEIIDTEKDETLFLTNIVTEIQYTFLCCTN